MSWPLLFASVELSETAIFELLQQFDEWYGNTDQDTELWATEYQLLCRMLISDVRKGNSTHQMYLLVNPLYLDLDDVLMRLREIIGEHNYQQWHKLYKLKPEEVRELYNEWDA